MISKLDLNVQERLQEEGRTCGVVMDDVTEQSTDLKLHGRNKSKTYNSTITIIIF